MTVGRIYTQSMAARMKKQHFIQGTAPEERLTGLESCLWTLMMCKSRQENSFPSLGSLYVKWDGESADT